MLSCWWVTKRKQNSSICILLLFFLSEGMFSEQKSPEETNVNPRWEKYYEIQPQGLCMNSRNLTRTNYFPECEETCKWITLKALPKGQNSGGRDLLQFLNQWGNSTRHATGHCIYCESQNQNGSLMRWLVGASKGQWSLGIRVGGQRTFPSLPFCPQGRFQYKHVKWVTLTLSHCHQECVFWNKHH